MTSVTPASTPTENPTVTVASTGLTKASRSVPRSECAVLPFQTFGPKGQQIYGIQCTMSAVSCHMSQSDEDLFY